MAGAPQKEETILIRLAVSKNVYSYLRILKRKTALGASEGDIARYILTQRIEQMIAEKYQDTQAIPTSAD
jgi:hypothetical protein